jgi:hypothetical protein
MLEIIKNPYDGDEWETIIDKCYRMRYQEQGYQKMPANFGGDAGVEGFTKSGIVYQCYCPEKQYSDNELWENQRDKVTRDINKLIENGKRLKAIGIKTVKEWHFVTPEYRDSRLLVQCEKKRKEVIEEKAKKNLDYIDEKFTITIKTAEDFANEISKLVFLYNDLKFDIAVKHTGEVDWKKCPSEKAENIKRKLKAVMPYEANPKLEVMYNKMINTWGSYYVNGIEVLSGIKAANPEIYEKIIKIDNMFRKKVDIKCTLNAGSSINKELFQEIMNEIDEELSKLFGDIFNVESVQELKWDLLGSWLADCLMDFM